MKTFCPWITPKIFDDLDNPRPGVESFFDHYADWIELAEQTVINFCTGNGDHILNYRGQNDLDTEFDWARYNAYTMGEGPNQTGKIRAHNQWWMDHVREGGETGGNPAWCGCSFILSNEVMTYHRLAGIYQAFREVAAERKVNMKLLEYFEPGPEFCRSDFKALHKEVMVNGVMDVTAPLAEDANPYASSPEGIRAGTPAGDFLSAQCGAFVDDFGLDGVYLGNQCGLVGFWHPENAPEATPERREGLIRFFKALRSAMGDHLIYWMDSYWPADVEMERWSMSEEAYAQLDGIMISNFAVIVKTEQIVPNIKSRLKVAESIGGHPDTLFSVDFFDPWYEYRVFLDMKQFIDIQYDLYKKWGDKCQGVSFFANDTFGLYVPKKPLDRTFEVIKSVG